MVKSKELLKNDSFCILPWLHVYKHQDNTVRLCCVDKCEPIGDLENDTIEEIRNGEKATSLRQEFLNGEKPDRCRECWTQESRGYSSYRQDFNGDFLRDKWTKDLEFKADEPLPLYYLDYRPSNLCNLACKICSPEYSTKLIDPHLELGTINKDQAARMSKYSKNRVSFETVLNNLDDVDFFYFAGGEPLITDDHWGLMDQLVKREQFDVKIKYNTNLTRLSYKDYHVRDYWKKFKKVNIAASLDGYGTGFEHMRTGGKWKDIVDNLNTLRQIINEGKEEILKTWGYQKKNYGIELNIDSTVGWLNLKSVFKLHRWLVAEGYVVLDDENWTRLVAKPLIFPYGSSLSSTPPELVPELLQAIEDQKTWYREVYKYGENWLPALEALETTIKGSSYSEDNLLSWIRWHVVLDKKYKLFTPDAFKFDNTKWNDKFYELYNRQTLRSNL